MVAVVAVIAVQVEVPRQKYAVTYAEEKNVLLIKRRAVVHVRTVPVVQVAVLCAQVRNAVHTRLQDVPSLHVLTVHGLLKLQDWSVIFLILMI